jgi:hypothetical protein
METAPPPNPIRPRRRRRVLGGLGVILGGYLLTLACNLLWGCRQVHDLYAEAGFFQGGLGISHRMTLGPSLNPFAIHVRCYDPPEGYAREVLGKVDEGAAYYEADFRWFFGKVFLIDQRVRPDRSHLLATHAETIRQRLAARFGGDH